MKIKAIINQHDPRQETYIRFLEKSFPELLNEAHPDMYFVLGGDGSMLYAHKDNQLDIPFFGKNLGTLGFIMNTFSNDFRVIEGLLNDTIQPIIVKTPKIQVTIKRAEETIIKSAINDVIIGGNISDWNSFELSAKSGLYNKEVFNGLGLSISTPLGSTAFNSNNNGKVLPIGSNLWSLTGVVTDKTLNEVIEPQSIKIKVLSKRSDPIVYIDGTADKILVTNGDIIKIRPTKDRFKIAFLNEVDFYNKRSELMRTKR